MDLLLTLLFILPSLIMGSQIYLLIKKATRLKARLIEEQDKVTVAKNINASLEDEVDKLSGEVIRLRQLVDEVEQQRQGVQDQLTSTIKIVNDLQADVREQGAKAEEVAKKQLQAWQKTMEKDIRADALKKSKAVHKGFLGENFAPMLADLPAKDFRHLGDPVDYLVVEGLHALSRGTQDKIDRVVLLDVKTGKASLSKAQRRIRDAIVEGRVAFAVFNPETGMRYWEPE